MHCWKCHKELESPVGRLSFQATCDYCAAWLHVCKNCRFYKPGMPNDCRIPDTLPISDREKANHCEEFALAERVDNPSSESDKLEKLFGEKKEEKKTPKDRFKDLFRD